MPSQYDSLIQALLQQQGGQRGSVVAPGDPGYEQALAAAQASGDYGSHRAQGGGIIRRFADGSYLAPDGRLLTGIGTDPASVAYADSVFSPYSGRDPFQAIGDFVGDNPLAALNPAVWGQGFQFGGEDVGDAAVIGGGLASLATAPMWAPGALANLGLSGAPETTMAQTLGGTGGGSATAGAAGAGFGLGDAARAALGAAGAATGYNSGGSTGDADLDAQLALAQRVRDLNLVDQNTPFGSSNYTIDPATGRVTRTDALSSALRGQFDQTTGLLGQRMGMLGGDFDPNAYGDIYGAESLDNYDVPLTNLYEGASSFFDRVDPLAEQYSQGAMDLADFTSGSGFDQRVEDALYERLTRRLDPQYSDLERQFYDRMAAQGATPGSEYYNRELANFQRDRGDAYRQAQIEAILRSGEETQRQTGLRQAGLNALGGAANLNLGAGGQMFGQNLQGNQFATDYMGQMFDQDLSALQFGNQAQQQAFNQGLSGRQQNVSELGFLGDMQRQTAGFVPGGFNAGSIGTPDLLGARQQDRQDKINNAMALGQLGIGFGNLLFGGK